MKKIYLNDLTVRKSLKNNIKVISRENTLHDYV